MKSSNYLKGLSKRVASDSGNLKLIKIHSANLSAFKADLKALTILTDDIIELIELLGRNSTAEIYKGLVTHHRAVMELLEKAILELEVVSELIKPAYRQQIQSETRSAITIILDKYTGWVSDLSSRDRRRIALAQKEISDKNQDITNLSRVAFDYGYGYYNNLAILFVCEYFLMLLLHKASTTKKSTVNRYISDYYEMSINYGVTHSVSSAHLRLVKEMNVLELNHQPNTYYTGITEKPNAKCVTLYDTYLHVEGNIRDGFRYRDELKYKLIYCERTPGRDSFMSESPLNSAAVSRHSVIDKYEKAYLIYHTVFMPRLASLAVAIDNCKKYITKLTMLRNSL